jgi:shikimate dehydrogenase
MSMADRDGADRDGAERGGPIRLGLIGDNIARSRSPDLHRLAGRICGLDIRYELLVPGERGGDFDTVFENCRAGGMRGVNVTYPYKEAVFARVRIDDAATRRIGSINTVVFEPDGARGYNTDHSGFRAAFREAFAEMAPGRVALVGAGGVGKAVAFALAELGAERLEIADIDTARAAALAAAISAAFGGAITVTHTENARRILPGADGVVNCTPLGMPGHSGSAVPLDLLGSQGWAFESVYTPVDTPFKIASQRAGLKVLSGYELFFHQGVDAFCIFTGRAPSDLVELRRRLAETPAP